MRDGRSRLLSPPPLPPRTLLPHRLLSAYRTQYGVSRLTQGPEDRRVGGRVPPAGTWTPPLTPCNRPQAPPRCPPARPRPPGTGPRRRPDGRRHTRPDDGLPSGHVLGTHPRLRHHLPVRAGLAAVGSAQLEMTTPQRPRGNAPSNSAAPFEGTAPGFAAAISRSRARCSSEESRSRATSRRMSARRPCVATDTARDQPPRPACQTRPCASGASIRAPSASNSTAAANAPSTATHCARHPIADRRKRYRACLAAGPVAS